MVTDDLTAPSITVNQLGAALRITVGDSDLRDPELTIITRLAAAAQALVQKYAPDAPPEIMAEAVVRIAGYLYDAPPAGAAQRYANAYVNSGAAALLNPWIERRAILPELPNAV